MNVSFRCAVIDDEVKAAELLCDCLKVLYRSNCVVEMYHHWEQALNALRAESYDIVFTDISMPEKNGIELLSLIPNLQAEIIFVTAHSDYAVKSFQFFPSGYLLKPIDELVLFATVNKALERVAAKKLPHRNNSQLDNKIGLPSNKGIDYVEVDSIIYLEGFQSYTRVVLTDGEIMSSNSIGRFLSHLGKYGFIQIHRSYVINPKHVKKYLTKGAVIIGNGEEIPVSRSSKDLILGLFSKVTRDDSEL